MKNKGFTLLELVVTIAILLVLSGIAGLSMKKSIERNDYRKMIALIPKTISVEANKAFEEGDEKTIEVSMDSEYKYIKGEKTEKELPKNYSYSFYLVARDDDGEMKSENTEKIGDSGIGTLKIDEDGRINEVQINSDTPKENLNDKLHPSILVEKNGVPFCRVDIISSEYITPKITVYKPDGATSSDMGNKDKWILDE